MQHAIITRETLVQRVLELSKLHPVNVNAIEISTPGKDVASGVMKVSLELVKEVSDACPAVPLRALSAVSLVLWDTAQTTKDNKKNLLRLATDSLELASIIVSHYYNANTEEWRSDMPKDHEDMFFRFIEQAYTIYLNADTLRNRSRFKRFFAAKMDVDTIKVFRETLDHARNVFVLETTLETNLNTRQLLSLATSSTPQPPPRTHSQPLVNSRAPSQPSPRPVSQPPPASPIMEDSPRSTTRPFSYPLGTPSGGGPASYFSVGRDYSNTNGNTYNNNNFNSGNKYNWDVKDSYNYYGR